MRIFWLISANMACQHLNIISQALSQRFLLKQTLSGRPPKKAWRQLLLGNSWDVVKLEVWSNSMILSHAILACESQFSCLSAKDVYLFVWGSRKHGSLRELFLPLLDGGRHEVWSIAELSWAELLGLLVCWRPLIPCIHLRLISIGCH